MEINDPPKLYKVVTVDYVFEKENYPFLDGQNHESTGDLVREVIADIIKNSENGKFTIR